jgi:hypothetical protein
MTMHHYWRIRDGKIDHFRGSEDTQQTALVLTPDLAPTRNSYRTPTAPVGLVADGGGPVIRGFMR